MACAFYFLFIQLTLENYILLFTGFIYIQFYNFFFRFLYSAYSHALSFFRDYWSVSHVKPLYNAGLHRQLKTVKILPALGLIYIENEFHCRVVAKN